MVEDGNDAPRLGADVTDARFALSAPLMAELALPALVAAVLALAVAPHAHGVARWAALAATVALAASMALNLTRTLQSAERIRRAEAAIAAAAGSLDSASRVTRAVLTALEQDVVPALGKMLVATGAMAADRRMSVSVRGRLATIRTAGENIEAILKGVIGAPPARPAEPRPVAVEAEAPAALPRFALTASDEPVQPDFEIDFPRAQEVSAADARAPSMRVLVAEGNGVHQLVLRTLLAQLGMEAEFVTDGAELMDAWRRENWDLIVVDAQTPQIDGPSAARTIRAIEMKFHWKDTPIIALATNPSAHDIDGYAEAGIDAWVSKPVVGASLFDAIRTAMAAQASSEAWEPMEMSEVA